jgi:hypothetical protein
MGGARHFVIPHRFPAGGRRTNTAQAIDKSVNRDSFQVVFVDLSGAVTKDYILTHGIKDFPVLLGLDAKQLVAYNLRFTPETILIDNDGTIQRVWAGLLDKGQVSELRSTLSRYDAVTAGRSPR